MLRLAAHSYVRNSLAEPDVTLIESRILLIRNQKVLLDSDLAALYCVTTGNLNKAVQRNARRFPEDLMFQLTAEEWKSPLIFQSGRSTHGGRRHAPYAFTEHGVVMLASVLASDRAIDASLAIVRTFVRLRQLLAAHDDIARRLDNLEWRQAEQDDRVQYVFDAIQHLIAAPAEQTKRTIGFPSACGNLLTHAATPE